VAVPVGPAGALDVAAEPGDPDHLDQRHLHRRRRRHVDGVHGVIGHALPHARQVQDHVDAERAEVVGRADAAEHQLLRAAQRPRRQDDLAGGAGAEVRLVSVASRVVVHNAVRHRLGSCNKILARRSVSSPPPKARDVDKYARDRYYRYTYLQPFLFFPSLARYRYTHSLFVL
jgi:hypothetical protein